MEFFLPVNYLCNNEPEYYHDDQAANSAMVYQPEVYDFVADLVKSKGARTVVDIGCGNAGKLMAIHADRIVGVDYGANIAACKSKYGDRGIWLEEDFEQIQTGILSKFFGPDCLIVCSDVIEHLVDPTALLNVLRVAFAAGATIVTSTPDRILVRGPTHLGPPPNLAHVREWALVEYKAFLESAGLPCHYIGYTLNNSVDRKLRTILSLHDGMIEQARQKLPEMTANFQKPLAIIAAYNEEDVLEEVVRDWVAQGCNVHLIDNWSSDQTYEIMQHLSSVFPEAVRIERFPESNLEQGEWKEILKRKEAIAAQNPDRWVIHTDADEVRRSMFQDLSLAEAFMVAQAYGANRVSFNLINFRPVASQISDSVQGTLAQMSYFEFGDRPGHFYQAKAWYQGEERVELSSSGGHDAVLSEQRDFPYRFLLKHYPLRSLEHAERKIKIERADRFSKFETQELGWHQHYSHLQLGAGKAWNFENLFLFDDQFWERHGLVMISGLADKIYLESEPRSPANATQYAHMLQQRIWG